MHYRPEDNDHGLKWTPFKSCVVPRPIGWISTVSVDGVNNLAPYSQFQNLSFDPPCVMIAVNQKDEELRKDTTINIEQTGEFVYNMATYELREAVNITSTSFPSDVDEFKVAGLNKAESLMVKPFRVAESPIQFECEYQQTVRIPGNGVGTVDLIIGRVVMVHIDDKVISPEGKVDILKARPLARLGYYDYTSVESIYEIKPPKGDSNLTEGLEGKRNL
ncbi:NADH-FMN oxidoreductase RutF, flavin reductase (DIM6/NTAB) family [Alteribacillus persepolensis]|uniref:NADH-FMN oxidoreductase RutF, flavin reductase (DIM6/NTAB) family n=1 Tax=Alteribacillus persepolensis TaxID=568899 RepID=A0A1G8K4W7_9BACI|nr:flavin reductase family protein [Alteribacillus persepolensis]SDI38437.1 NADH-FMN oxidoreductase RutF, flavin reductase (DIM6/NTAB) family [Alteribacillus persepolensis]